MSILKRLAAVEAALGLTPEIDNGADLTGEAKVAKQLLAEIEDLEKSLEDKKDGDWKDEPKTAAQLFAEIEDLEKKLDDDKDGIVASDTQLPKQEFEQVQEVSGATGLADVPNVADLQKQKVASITARLDRLAEICEQDGDKETALAIDKISDEMDGGAK